jgi:hypothetical protein
MRFAIRRRSFMKPLLALFGGVESRSFVEIEGGKVRAVFGLFDESFDVAEIQSAGRTSWPFLAGIGWRVWFGGTVGLIGDMSEVVELVLKTPRKVGAFPIKVECRRLCVSLEDADGFLKALEAARGSTAA